MTNVKKVVAVMLAFLMIFSSASVLASAWDATVDDGSALNIETKFFKEVGGEWVETTKVKPGDVVKARVYLSTEYYSNDSSLLFFYDKDFFTHNYSNSATEYNTPDNADKVVNTEAGSFAATNNVTANIAANPVELAGLVSEGYIDSAFLDEYGAISAVVKVDPTDGKNVQYDNSTWLLEFTLTVKDDAEGEGDFFVKDTTVQNSTTQTYAVVNVPKGPADGTDADIWAMWLWDANVTLNSNPVSTYSSITFNANTGTFADGKDTYVVDGMIDDAVDATAIPAVTKDGYAFMGWIDAADTTPTYEEILDAVPATIPENDLVLNAYWMETVDITFDTGAGSKIETITGAKPYDTFADIEDPTLDGYTFKGWDVKGGDLPATYPDVDTTYTAVWAKQVTVSFDTNGADAIPSVDGDAGDTFDTVVEDPSKEGHYFIGWEPALPTVFPEQDTTYNAIFETHAYKVKYYFVDETHPNGKLVATAQIEYGMPIPTVVPTLEINAGEILDGWYTDAGLKSKLAAGAVMPALSANGEYKLYATTSPATFDAIFLVDGEVYATVPTLYEADIIAPGDEKSDIAEPAKAGYVFTGWDPYPATLDQPNNMEFTALWTEAQNTIQYIVDGGAYETFTNVEYGAEFEVAADPVKEGYTFVGWTDVEGGETPVELPKTMPADSVVTYYAIFKIDSHNVTWNNEDGSVYEGPVSYVYNTAVEKPATDPSKTGWTFKGWKDADGKLYDAETAVPAMGTEDVTYTAYFEINQYTITFNSDGGSAVEAIKQDYNTAVTAPADPTKTGYTFKGWEPEVPATMPANDMTVKAKWEINQYTITFDVDGGSAVEAIKQDYNTAVTAPADPTKTGYTFTGWEPAVPATMPAENITVKAQWKVNSYKVTWVYDDGVTADVEESYNYGATINTPATPDKKVGYTFNSWSPAVDATMPAQDVTYTATWDANTYNAVFDANGGKWADGDVSKTVPTKYDAPIDTTTVGLTKDDAAAPTMAGYVFNGWDPAVGTMNSVDGLTFTAKWVKATDTKYTVETYTMNTEGVHVLTSSEIFTGTTDDSVDATPTDLSKGFKFNAEKSEATGKILADSSLVLKVYIDREKYTLTTIVDEDTTPTEYLFGQSVSVTEPSKAGYDFAGWDGEVPATMPANDVTLTATWTARNDTVFYVVMHYTDDVSGNVTVDDKYELTGTTDSTVAVVEEIPADAAENTTYVLVSDIESYFSGVFAINHYKLDTAEGDVKITADGAAEVDVYYVPVDYTITFDSGEGTYENGVETVDAVLKYNALVNAGKPADPSKDGYTFKGYRGLTDTTRVAGNRTYTAYYEANPYTLKFVIEPDNIQESTVTTDTAISAPAVNDKAGYKFLGWSDVEGGKTPVEIPTTMPAGDRTYYAIWQIQQYTVTFYNEKGDAEGIFTTTADYATEYNVPTATKTGYTFDKWMNADTDAVVTFADGKGTIPAGNASYYATWTINQYTITFDTDGGSTVGAIKQDYNTAVTKPADPTKTGYTFKGWEPEVPATMPANDMTVKAQWTINQYEIKFDSQGGSNVETVKADYNSQVAKPADPTKDGYTFKGWATTAGVTDATQAVAFPVTVPLNGTTYYAIWETNNYTITFDSKGGSAVPSVEQPYLSSVAKPADPTLEGYTFGGWSATDGGTTAVTFPVTMPLNGATYYAIWTIESYTVNWISDGATAKSESVNFGGTLTAPAVEKTGYSLDGWYDADGNKVPATIGDIGNTGAAITYTAKWTANTYNAVFDANGGAWGSETTKTVPTKFDDAIIPPANPVRAGYEFSTWDPAVGTMNSVDGLTFKAVWVADSDTKYTVETYTMNTSGTYDMTSEVKGAATDSIVNVKPATVAEGFQLNDTLSVYEGKVTADNGLVLKVYIDRKSFNFNTAVTGGTTTEATPYLFGATVVVPEKEEKTGYTFDGWYYDGTKYEAGASFTMPAKDVTLTGTLTINEYTATWVFDNGTADQVDTYDYNETIVKPADPEKEGYNFAGWLPAVDATMPANNVTYTAQWTAKDYTITFTNTGDTTIAPITQAYLSDVTAPADPEKAGHTFAGWYDENNNKVNVPAKMPLGGMTLKAEWTVNKYLVTFYKDADKADVVYSNEVDFGTALSELSVVDPTKTGHTFAGWAYEGTTDKIENLANETVPVGGANLIALWTVNDVELVYRTYNGVHEEYKVPFGTAKADIPVPADPVRTGWTFTGWSPELPETMPASRLTINAQWKQETYAINWVSDGKEVTGDESIFVPTAVYGDEIVAPEMEKLGYTFNGWDYNGATYAAGDYIAIADAGVDGAEITITANWTANTYVATFDANGGAWGSETTKTVETVFDTAITAPEQPTRAGYTFSTWEPTVGNMIEEGMTFKAIWIAETDTKYTVITYTMNADGDYVADNNGDGVVYTAATDSIVNVKPESVAEGFVLNDTLSVYEGKVTADNGLVLKVYIDRVVNTVTTTLDGKVTGTQEVRFGATVTVPADGVKEGYSFDGWTVNGTAYESNATFEMPAEPVAIVGTFTVNQYNAIFYVDGEVFATVPTNFGEVPVAPDATNAKPGYTFVEWTPALVAMTTAGAEYNGVFTAKGDTPYTVEIYTMGLDGNYGEAVVENYTGATDTEAVYAPAAKEGFSVADSSVLKGNIEADGSLTLKVYYSRNDYTITYNVDGAQYKVETYKYGADITILAEPEKEGHTFSGWDATLDATMPAENLVINGTFAVNDYTITYNVDGSEYKVETYKYGADITILAEPEKEGHTFSGWDATLPATMPAENLVINGTFSANTYKITYMVDGSEYKVEEYVFGDAVTALEAPVKEGYTFSGWDKKAPATMTAGDITISGTFTVNQYNAIFYVDGEVFATVPTNFGEVPVAPDATNAKPGYTFVEWTPALVAMTTAGAEYNAVFEVNSNTAYIVEIYTMDTEGKYGDAVVENYTGETDTEATYTPAVKEGFTVADESVLKGNIDGDGSLVLKVYYSRNKVTVNVNGDSDEYYYGEEITEPERPTPPEGYEQPETDGWKDQNGDPVNFPITVPSEDTVITPVFVPKEYKATFIFDDGTEEVKNIAYLSVVTAPDAPAKEGYKFIGWRDEANVFLTDATTMPAKDVTYTAIYEITTAGVKYYVNGELVGTALYEYGSVIPTVIPTYTTPVGYEFDGWYTDADCKIKLADGATFGSGITAVYAKETAKTYDAIFMVDGEVYATVPTAFDADIIAPGDEKSDIAAPTKDGYTFTGWDPYVGTMDQEGITFTAQWIETANAYTITYMVDGEVHEAFPIAVNDEFEVASEPVKEGYTFVGWTNVEGGTEKVELPKYMPAENLTYYAIFTINTHTVNFYNYEAEVASPWKSADAVVIHTHDYDYNEIIAFPADPTNIDSAYWTFLGWSTEEGGEVIADTSDVKMIDADVNYYAVYEKVAVKLVPTEGSTTMIERNGAIESYNDGYSVSAEPIKAAEGETFAKYLIYGLKTGLRDTVLATETSTVWVEVLGDGYTTVTPVQRNRLGTGSLVEVYDRNGTDDKADDILVEQFYVVIFGDLDGNARFTTSDSGMIDEEILAKSWSSGATKVEYMFRAANLDGNRRITTSDGIKIDEVLLGATINQVTGEVV